MSHRFKTPQYDSYESDERSDGSGQEDTPSAPGGLPSALTPIEALDVEPAEPEVVVSFSKKKSKKSKVSKEGHV